MYAVVNDKTGLIVGTYSTIRRARIAVDRMDSAHGGYNFSVRVVA